MYALQQLEDHLKEGACALDVGSGSGYLTAAMAYMVILSNLKTVELHCTFSQTFYISLKGQSLSDKTSRNQCSKFILFYINCHIWQSPVIIDVAKYNIQVTIINFIKNISFFSSVANFVVIHEGTGIQITGAHASKNTSKKWE